MHIIALGNCRDMQQQSFAWNLAEIGLAESHFAKSSGRIGSVLEFNDVIC
jgi:hypothetical protein